MTVAIAVFVTIAVAVVELLNNFVIIAEAVAVHNVVRSDVFE